MRALARCDDADDDRERRPRRATNERIETNEDERTHERIERMSE